MVNIVEMLLTNHNRPKKKLIKLKGLVIHWTANTSKGANAIANRNYFNSTTNSCSAHYIIDDKQIVKCIPDDEVGYHVGAKKYTKIGESLREGTVYSPNYFTVGVEMCVNLDGDWNRTYQNTVEFSAKFLIEHGLTIDNLYRHYDITGKLCPQMMINENEWKKFKDEVNKLMNPISKQGKILVTLNIRKSYSTTSSIVGKLNKNDLVTILEEKDGWYKIDKGWIFGNSGKYVEIIKEKNIEENTKVETKIQYPTIYKGSKGEYVKILQNKLKELGYNIVIDGDFGKGTEATVKQFQGVYKLEQDGIVGNATWNKLMSIEKVSEEIKEDNNLPKEYMYKDCKVIELNPLSLKIGVYDLPANKVPMQNIATSIYQTWEAVLENGKKTNKVKSVPLGILVSDGKLISNRQPHINDKGIMYPAGTLIVHNDGTVECKFITSILSEREVKFAVSGCSILPKIRLKEEGFCKRKCMDGKIRDFSDIARTTSRICIGYNSKKNKILIVAMPKANIGKAQLIMKELGCDFANTEDGGGSTILRINGKYFINTTRQLYAFITW